MKFDKGWVGLIVVVICGVVSLSTIGTCIYLAIIGRDVPANLQAFAFSSFTGMLGLLKTAHTGDADANLSEEQLQSLSQKVVQAMQVRSNQE